MEKNKVLRNHSLLFNIVAVILWIWALSFIFVLLWGIVSSCRDGIAFAINDTSFFGLNDKEVLPSLKHTYTLKNYGKAFRELKDDVTQTTFFGMFFNSLWLSVGLTLAGQLFKITTAYALAFYGFKGRSAIYKFFILQMIIPGFGSGIAGYRILSSLGMVDSPWYILSVMSGDGMFMLIYYGAFIGLTHSYADAARIDGANEFSIFLNIYLPMVKSVVLALAVQVFINLWQDYATMIIYMPSYPTLATGLFKYTARAAYVMDTPTYFAGLLIANFPIAIVFIACNKTILENVCIGGLKG